ncbi:MAG: hypothetical protein HY221_00800, partial [Candidatus Sungbacteria bacterium]|nr:hypothetical protein [Candidatus Sungbacteria bacterium]
ARYTVTAGATDVLGHPGFYLAGAPFKFFPSPSGGSTAVLDGSGGLFLFDENSREIHPVEGGVEEVSFDQSEEKLLIRKNRSIEVLWLKPNRYQPFQPAGVKETIAAPDQTITGSAWLYEDNAHVAFSTAGGIFLTELDGRGGRNTVQLAHGGVSDLASSTVTPNALFFRRGKTTYRIDL